MHTQFVITTLDGLQVTDRSLFCQQLEYKSIEPLWFHKGSLAKGFLVDELFRVPFHPRATTCGSVATRVWGGGEEGGGGVAELDALSPSCFASRSVLSLLRVPTMIRSDPEEQRVTQFRDQTLPVVRTLQRVVSPPRLLRWFLRAEIRLCAQQCGEFRSEHHFLGCCCQLLRSCQQSATRGCLHEQNGGLHRPDFSLVLHLFRSSSDGPWYFDHRQTGRKTVCPELCRAVASTFP